jgi:uncharacterized protein YvpB
MRLMKLITNAIEAKFNLPADSYETIGRINDLDFAFLSDDNSSIDNRTGTSIEELNQVVYEGSVVFMYNAFNDEDTYFSKPILNPTVLDLQKSLDDGLKFTDSTHSIFLEELVVVKNNFDDYLTKSLVENKPKLENVVLINMETGS